MGGGARAGQFSESGQKLYIHRKPEQPAPTSHGKEKMAVWQVGLSAVKEQA